MKTYKIGRNPDNDIVIQDDTRLVSRYHAVLKVHDNGTMTICDTSTNGTYINREKINSNIEVSVTKNDSVYFAKQVQLDWNKIQIPQNINSAATKYNPIYVEPEKPKPNEIKKPKSNTTTKTIGWLLILVGVITIFNTGISWTFEGVCAVSVPFIGGVILLVKAANNE